MATTPLSAVEALLTYGGDYTLTPTGDIAVVQDQPYSPAATVQRITFLILSNPAITNVAGGGSSLPDDIFNPSYGSGARAYVGRSNTQSIQDAVIRNIMSALLADPFIAQSPRPTVTLTPSASDPSTLNVSITFTAITGQNVTVPDIAIAGGSP